MAGKARQMTRIRRTLVATGEAAAPRGRVWRLQARMTLDLLLTLAVMALAAVSTIGYQAIRWWAGRSGRA